jgi:Matrixin/Carboxypeptidase regulatory-like domain
MRRLTSALSAAVLLSLTASTAGAYYHFVHYTNTTAPFNPIVEKFDLQALPNHTVSVFVFDLSLNRIQQPNGSSWVLNSIRDAAQAWNGVSATSIRVAYGGLISGQTPQAAPGIDVQFDELDPATLGLTGHLTSDAPLATESETFIPILRSTIQLNSDLSNWNVGSQHESFFLTVVHEMGHALGLQHTFTSSIMSTEPTRATTYFDPIQADDVAGVALLYPRAGFFDSMGSISGRVSFEGGTGVHLASVVAIQPSGIAISALTGPDGNYRIDGIPPGQYMLYVHTVPPALRVEHNTNPGDLILPTDVDGNSMLPSPGFYTEFLAGEGVATRDPAQAALLDVASGKTNEGINFTVNPRADLGIGPVTTYSYFGTTPVRPGFLQDGGVLVAQGAGLASNNQLTFGLKVSFLGGNPALLPGGMLAYADTNVALYLDPATFVEGSSGPRHAVFSLPNDLYIRPAAFRIVHNAPPSIASVTPSVDDSGRKIATIVGDGLTSETRFAFDGVRAKVLQFTEEHHAIVALPPARAGYQATVTAFNPDGQNSTFLKTVAAAVPSFAFDSGQPGSVTLSPGSIHAGIETMLDITGVDTSFADGYTTLGFGSSDVEVRRIWVLSPTHMLANVAVSPSAPAGQVMVSVLSGLKTVAQPFGFTISAPVADAPSINSSIVNENGYPWLYAGATAVAKGVNLTDITLTLSDQPVSILSVNEQGIRFQVPAGIQPGLAVLRSSKGGNSASIILPIGTVPPQIRSVSTTGGINVDTQRPAQPGDVLYLNILALGAPGSSIDPARISITVAGIPQTATDCTTLGTGHSVRFVLTSDVPTTSPSVPLTVTIDGRFSVDYSLPIRSSEPPI